MHIHCTCRGIQDHEDLYYMLHSGVLLGMWVDVKGSG